MIEGMVIGFEDSSALKYFEEVLVHWGGEAHPQAPRVFEMNQLLFTESDFKPEKAWGCFNKESSDLLKGNFFIELGKKHISILNGLEWKDSQADNEFKKLSRVLKTLCEKESTHLKVILYKDDGKFRNVRVASEDELLFFVAEEYGGKGDESDEPIYYFYC
jgi:hypothetical protein